MKAHEFHAATVAAIRGRCWADARNEVAAALTLDDAGEMLAEVERMRHDAMAVLLDKLRALGARRLDWARCYEVRLNVWWRATPADGVSYCIDDQPSPRDRDWVAPDDLDAAVPEGDRVQTLGDDVTLVLTDGFGALVFCTSKRVERGPA